MVLGRVAAVPKLTTMRLVFYQILPLLAALINPSSLSEGQARVSAYVYPASSS
jgi:hypothetical protein